MPLHMHRRRWHGLKLSSALSKFAIFLSSCKNALGSSLYASKFGQTENLQKLVFKLPFAMRERWRRSANDIMELQSRPVKFGDLVAFVDREARIATNPVFGNISSFAKSGSGSARRSLQSRAVIASSKVKTSPFVTRVQNNRRINPEQNSDADPVVLGSQSKTCPFCQKSHALEECLFLRWKPYQERIKFLSSMRLCFGCLSDNHVARLCPQRKVWKIPIAHGSILQSFILQAFVKSLRWTLVSEARALLILKFLMPWPAQSSMLIPLMEKLVAGQR